MKKRLVSVLAFALAVSAGAAFVLYQLIASRVKVGAAAPKPVTAKVLVASRDLELGTLIQDRDLVEQEYLTPPAGAVLKKEDIVGRGVANPIHQDSPFYESSLSPKGSGAGFASIIPKGMRAFAVHVNEVVGVAGFAVPGMRVDILVSGTPPNAQNTGAVTRTLLQNIEVLSAGQNFRKDAEGKPVLVQVVNLLVTPQQAEILNLATEQSIQLVLRNPADQEITNTSGAATSSLFAGTHSAPLMADPGPVRVARPKVVEDPPPVVESHPVALPQTLNIEVFHGGQKTESTVRVDEQEQAK